MEFGARPLKRIVQSQVETLIAKKLIANEIVDGDKIEVYYDKRIAGLNIRPKQEIVSNGNTISNKQEETSSNQGDNNPE